MKGISKEAKATIIVCCTVFAAIIFGFFLTMGISAIYNVYNVWKASKSGEALYASAEFKTRVATLEAKAKEESASHIANAEIVRAKGVAESNKIIGDSLKGNEAYLRYLWIDGLQHSQGQVVYVPTEAGLPILEAGGRNRYER